MEKKEKDKGKIDFKKLIEAAMGSDETAELAIMDKLSRDLKKASVTLTEREVRYLVDTYYLCQEMRKRSGNQIGALTKDKEPHELITWFFQNSYGIELEAKKALTKYAESKVEGIWLQSIVGIGPVIAAGLIAHVDYKDADGNELNTAGSLWRFAGLDPTVDWGKGEKRPWNASLRTLCWKVGESFNKQQNRPNDFYGKLLVKKKDYYVQKNEAGDYRERALQIAEDWKKNRKTSSDAYKLYYTKGVLSPGHIQSMAKRYSVKIFLSHYLEALYEIKTGKKWTTKPYAIAILNHAHSIDMPDEQRKLLDQIVLSVH